MKFTIETVTKMTGISAASLRNWEKRYGFPAPERTDGGHRFYSADDVEFLKNAARLIEEGHCLSEVAKKYRATATEKTKQNIQVTDDVDYRTRLIYEALLSFDQAATLQHYQILNAKLSPEQLFDRVFESLLRRIRSDIQAREISPAQFRFSVSFIRMKLSVFLAMEFPPTQKSRIIVTNLWSHENEADLMLLSAHLKFRGYPVFYFGAELQAEDIGDLVDDIEPDILCLIYQRREEISRDLDFLKTLTIPVYLASAGRIGGNLEPRMDKNIHFCGKSSGSEAALFIEMICQAKSSAK